MILSQLSALALSSLAVRPDGTRSAAGAASKTDDGAAVSQWGRVTSAAFAVDPSKDTLVDTVAQLARALSYLSTPLSIYIFSLSLES